MTDNQQESNMSNVGLDTQSADALFSRLDTNQDGNISQTEVSKSKGHGHHHHHSSGGDSVQGTGSDAMGAGSLLLQSIDPAGASSQTTSNPDGSSTTTNTYADGSSVSATTPAAVQGAPSAAQSTTNGNSNNLLETLIRMQSEILSQSGRQTAVGSV
jgi:hypothetical protein